MNFFWYRWLLRPWLFRLSPERAQSLAEFALSVRPVWRLIGSKLRVREPALARTIAGIKIDNPVGLAAGYDKQCQHLASLGHLGFGYVVGGTVVPNPQAGNPKPRLIRYPKYQSLVNSMGFPSQGLDVVVNRLQLTYDRPTPIFISIAANDEQGYVTCFRRLERLADAIELNISSPNTKGLRIFQEPKRLEHLISRLNPTQQTPLFLKLPPYSSERERERIMRLAQVGVSSGISGFTLINTLPIDEPKLKVGRGGLSGPLIYPQMLKAVKELRQEIGREKIINACGGIFTGQDAFDTLCAGADTVQLYTALIYKGPTVVRTITLDLARLLSENQQFDHN